MKYIPIITAGNYTLLQSETQYVVCKNYNSQQPEGLQWDHGNYFTHWNESEKDKVEALANAIEFLRSKVDEDFIVRSRLEELATMFKEGLIKDDVDSAQEYFISVCEMSDKEREYFGVKK